MKTIFKFTQSFQRLLLALLLLANHSGGTASAQGREWISFDNLGFWYEDSDGRPYNPSHPLHEFLGPARQITDFKPHEVCPTTGLPHQNPTVQSTDFTAPFSRAAVDLVKNTRCPNQVILWGIYEDPTSPTGLRGAIAVETHPNPLGHGNMLPNLKAVAGGEIEVRTNPDGTVLMRVTNTSGRIATYSDRSAVNLQAAHRLIKDLGFKDSSVSFARPDFRRVQGYGRTNWGADGIVPEGLNDTLRQRVNQMCKCRPEAASSPRVCAAKEALNKVGLPAATDYASRLNPGNLLDNPFLVSTLAMVAADGASQLWDGAVGNSPLDLSTVGGCGEAAGTALSTAGAAGAAVMLGGQTLATGAAYAEFAASYYGLGQSVVGGAAAIGEVGVGGVALGATVLEGAAVGGVITVGAGAGYLGLRGADYLTGNRITDGLAVPIAALFDICSLDFSFPTARLSIDNIGSTAGQWTW